jgi:endoglucanase Acf2
MTILDKSSLTSTLLNSRQSNIFKVKNGQADQKAKSKHQSRNSLIPPSITTSTAAHSFMPFKTTSSTKSTSKEILPLSLWLTGSHSTPKAGTINKSPIGKRPLQLNHTRQLTETNHFYKVTHLLKQSTAETMEPISTIINQSDASQGFMISFSDPKNIENDQTLTRQIDFIQDHRVLLPCDYRRSS